MVKPGADAPIASDVPDGAGLTVLCDSWRDVQQTRIALSQRGLVGAATELQSAEEKLGRQISKLLRKHPLWPWLSQFPGLGGVHTAMFIGRIGDPRRFPGQKCSIGHTMAPDYEIGTPCPAVGRDDETCPGTMLEPRTTTGVRSLWHYAGLHVDAEGRSPKKRRGQRVSWDPRARTCVLQPGGIAEHIVRSRVPVYRDIYDVTKERLSRERGAGGLSEADADIGSALPGEPLAEYDFVIGDRGGAGLSDAPEVNSQSAAECTNGLRPIQIEGIARKVAAKAFVGDLLTEWKALVVPGARLDLGSGEGLS